MPSPQDRRYTVYLRDAGTHRVTRHTIAAPDASSAIAHFSDRGLHTVKVERHGLYHLKLAAFALASAGLLALFTWAAIVYWSA